MKNDDDETFDEHGVMRGNGTFRVPVQFMDSAQRAVADSTNAETARDKYIRELGDAWQTPEPTPKPATNPKAKPVDGASAYNAMVRDLGNAWRTP